MITPDLCLSEPSSGALFEASPARRTRLGALEIRRALPLRERRLVGPWCFLDRYGPVTFSDAKPMDLAPHPHIGLQTVTWLLEGEVLHRDSVGCESLIRPGEVNVMTAGRGIAHSEETPRPSSGRLSGVQLWVALPEASRHREPGFEHHEDLPLVQVGDGELLLMMGELAGAASKASTFSPMLGAELRIARNGRIVFPLRRDFEHALLVLDGAATLEGQPLELDVLYYLGTHRDELSLTTREGARLLLLGGTPFGETILMWWNYVARTHEEIVAANEDWAAGRRFGEVVGYKGPRFPAPPLSGRAKPPAAS